MNFSISWSNFSSVILFRMPFTLLSVRASSSSVAVARLLLHALSVFVSPGPSSCRHDFRPSLGSHPYTYSYYSHRVVCRAKLI